MGGEHYRPAHTVAPWRRFIPAWAGNTSLRAAHRSVAAVHPRVGGEHAAYQPSIAAGTGSSPRGRGTRLDRLAYGDRKRFIPAWAGNTPRIVSAQTRPTVHPRVGGEHWRRANLTHRVDGSSPRGRGTPRHRSAQAGRLRFIPAWAGNTLGGRGPDSGAAVHPRVGGEHYP